MSSFGAWGARTVQAIQGCLFFLLRDVGRVRLLQPVQLSRLCLKFSGLCELHLEACGDLILPCECRCQKGDAGATHTVQCMDHLPCEKPNQTDQRQSLKEYLRRAVEESKAGG